MLSSFFRGQNFPSVTGATKGLLPLSHSLHPLKWEDTPLPSPTPYRDRDGKGKLCHSHLFRRWDHAMSPFPPCLSVRSSDTPFKPAFPQSESEVSLIQPSVFYTSLFTIGSILFPMPSFMSPELLLFPAMLIWYVP